MVRLLHLPQRDGDTLHAALMARLGDLPAALLRSITWDQGTEMARHLTIAESPGAPSTSATRDHHGSAARTRTRTDCYATTSRKAPTSAPTPLGICWRSRTS